MTASPRQCSINERNSRCQVQLSRSREPFDLDVGGGSDVGDVSSVISSGSRVQMTRSSLIVLQMTQPPFHGAAR
jgi:hypothetical protein